MQIGELGSHLASFQPQTCSVGQDLQPCQVTSLLGNKLEACSVSAAWAGLFASSKWLASAVLEHGEVGRGCRFPDWSGQICFLPRPAVGSLCRFSWAGSGQICFAPRLSWNVATLSGDSFAWQKLETCSVSAACSMGRTVQHG